jgi:hypothetical protein
MVSVEMIGNALCIRKQDGTLVEIMDSVCFYVIVNGYVYFEHRYGGAYRRGGIECELFSIDNYISTGVITMLSISQYRNNRPFNVNNNGIDNATWNEIWDQELCF